MRTIFTDAVALLRDDREDPSVRDACAALLSVALEAGLDVPEGAALALFRWLVGHGSGRSWTLPEALSHIRDETVTREAIELLRRQDASRQIRDTTIDVLSGPAHAPLLDDDVLLDLARRHEADAEHLARLVEAVHEARGVDQSVLEAIRDRWLFKRVEARLGSISVAVLTKFSPTFWRRALHDPHSMVRSAAAMTLAKEGEPSVSIRILSERLLIEPVILVKAELLLALGKLVLRMES